MAVMLTFLLGDVLRIFVSTALRLCRCTCPPTTLRPGSTDSGLAVGAQRPCIFMGLSTPHQD